MSSRRLRLFTWMFCRKALSLLLRNCFLLSEIFFSSAMFAIFTDDIWYKLSFVLVRLSFVRHWYSLKIRRRALWRSL
jgi:hypothetical protein